MSVLERHGDFERTRAEFIKYYGSVQEGDREYKAWRKALGLDEDKSYGQSQERFSFVKPDDRQTQRRPRQRLLPRPSRLSAQEHE